jgi:3-deoxy-D-manno-octulosonic-acid transferase
MSTVYNIIIYSYYFLIKIAAATGNAKAKSWVEGRRKEFERLKKSIGKYDEIIWFHCASLGEFEQGRPVIEKVKKTYPNHKILLTFFSPSGYENKKHWEGADYIFYLPVDTHLKAKKFVSIVKPKVVVFVKYEFWFNYINELYKRKIPLIIISAVFRPGQYFFKFWGYWFKRQMQKISYIFVQDERSSQLLNSINIYHNEVVGDTRFDRVVKIMEEAQELPFVEEFKGGGKLLVAGSTWHPDEAVLHAVMRNEPQVKLIVAPHVTDKRHIDELVKRFSAFNPVLYSQYSKGDGNIAGSRVFIIDTMGMLSKLYRYADLAYIGGGFGAGIHNTAEAAVYGVPVMFGPNYKKFREAVALLDRGGAFTFDTEKEALKIAGKLLSDDTFRIDAGKKAAAYIMENRGATNLITDKIKEYLIPDMQPLR